MCVCVCSITHLKSEFRVFYLDDGTIGGAEAEVLQNFQFIECQAAHSGLHLNRAKMELICEDLVGSLLLEVNSEEAFLLGSPIGRLTSINSAIKSVTCP